MLGFNLGGGEMGDAYEVLEGLAPREELERAVKMDQEYCVRVRSGFRCSSVRSNGGPF
jgi:hypothetical protein